MDIEEGIIPQVNGRALDFIPFLMVSHQGIRPSDVRPPFSGLCRVALSHFRNSCDREHAIFLTSAPTPWVSGSLTEDRIPRAIGAGALWVLPEGAQVGMLEFTGAGVSAMKELMEEKIEVMAQLGARMLTTTVNRNESIETATQRTRGELSLLHGTVVSVEAGINKLLRIAAEWVGAPPAEAHVEMSRDFIEATLNGRQIEGLVKLWQSGGISHRTLYENLQAGEVASPDRTFEQEREMIADEGGDMGATMLRLPIAS
ncbi:62kDa structural protein [Lutibaculum baratangense AMV1]|uniref:62kDa structural protein n=1 Tax=Lutibaculum baratangense AMV1 TaxID=631454 RepID=V4TPA6_9HYPH|nr:62kDa structural protein [Lutibaculum baratangense AMV1]